jgi:hypothetical protein
MRAMWKMLMREIKSNRKLWLLRQYRQLSMKMIDSTRRAVIMQDLKASVYKTKVNWLRRAALNLVVIKKIAKRIFKSIRLILKQNESLAEL